VKTPGTLRTSDRADTQTDRAPGTLKRLVGSGDRIMLLTLPVLVVGLILNIASPSAFSVGGPPASLRVLSIAVLIPGVIFWAWSVALILTKVPSGQLITTGPYALVKHPLYTGVALLVLPSVGFLLDTWLGAAVGAAVYLGSRMFAPREEAQLAATFGSTWNDYLAKVKIRWL
jgi:protein-S-isoprenylcysteine O-methyltransferase Ste14